MVEGIADRRSLLNPRPQTEVEMGGAGGIRNHWRASDANLYDNVFIYLDISASFAWLRRNIGEATSFSPKGWRSDSKREPDKSLSHK